MSPVSLGGAVTSVPPGVTSWRVSGRTGPTSGFDGQSHRCSGVRRRWNRRLDGRCGRAIRGRDVRRGDRGRGRSALPEDPLDLRVGEEGDLARSGPGEENALVGAQLGGLAVHIGAVRRVAVLIVDEARPDIHIGAAVALDALLVDLVHGDEVVGDLAVLHRRQADPDHGDPALLEDARDRVDPLPIEVLPAVRQGLDRLVALPDRLPVARPEHHDGDGGLLSAIEGRLDEIRPVGRIGAHEADIAAHLRDHLHVRVLGEMRIEALAGEAGQRIAEHHHMGAGIDLRLLLFARRLPPAERSCEAARRAPARRAAECPERRRSASG